MSIDGRPATVARCTACDFVSLCCDGPVTVEVELPEAVREVVVRPLSQGVRVMVEQTRASFILPNPRPVLVEIPGRRPLYVIARPPIAEPSGGDVVRFTGGKAHDVGVLDVRAGQTVYLEPGAVLRGAIRASGANGASIVGNGIIDGSVFAGSWTSRAGGVCKSIEIEGCHNVIVDGLTVVNPSFWMCVPAVSRGVTIRNVSLLGEKMSGDGIDVVGCQDVLVEGCLVHTNDDCLAVKSTNAYDLGPIRQACDHRGDVRNVVFRQCILNKGRPGNTTEVGFETQADEVADITFDDIDVIGCADGSILSIHNGDRATVRDVLYRNIRVERFYGKFIDLRVLASRWSQDAHRGRVRNVTFCDIHTCPDPYNTPSLIGGWDADHDVRGVTFEGVHIGEKRVSNGDALHLFTKHVQDVQFR